MNIDELKRIIREEIRNYYNEIIEMTGDELSQEQILPSKDKTKDYCRRYGFMNTTDWLKTINNLQKSYKGKLYKKA